MRLISGKIVASSLLFSTLHSSLCVFICVYPVPHLSIRDRLLQILFERRQVINIF